MEETIRILKNCSPLDLLKYETRYPSDKFFKGDKAVNLESIFNALKISTNAVGSTYIDELLNSFQIAVSHNTYFCIFPAFNALRRIDYFSEFILDFIKSRDYVISTKDSKNINRLAFELGMDCFFVNRRILFNGHTDDINSRVKSAMITLLLHSPLIKGGRIYARNFADRFLRDANRFNVRDGKNIARKFIKAIDSVYDNHSFIHIENERIEFLNELKNNQDGLFVNVCNVLNINN